MLRQGDTGDWIGTFTGHKGAVWSVALNSEATKAASGAADFTAKVWDAVSGEELFNFTHQHIVKSVDFSADGNYLLTASNEKLLRIYDLNQPDSDPVTFSGHTSNIRRAVFLHDGTQVVSAADDKTVRIWDRNTQEELRKLEFPANPSSLEVSADGQLLVVAHGHVVTFYDTDKMEQVKTYTIPTQVNSASIHPNKIAFVCGGEDFKMYKCDYESGDVLESFKGHFGPVHCVRFSPDGELYASGSEDGTLRLWQTTVGNTYGLWKCISAQEATIYQETGNGTSPSVKAEA